MKLLEVLDHTLTTFIVIALIMKFLWLQQIKAQLAEKGHLFFGNFDKKNLFLGFEAAVLGAVPVVRGIEQSILPSKVKAIYGIFNGTTNYIISQMYENKISLKTH